MYSSNDENKMPAFDVNSDVWHVYQLRQPGNIINAEHVNVGGYYIYKEKHGMVCIVKVLKKTSKDNWIGFRLMVKRVLYSIWQVPVGTIFDTGFNLKSSSYPATWYFEPYMTLI